MLNKISKSIALDALARLIDGDVEAAKSSLRWMSDSDLQHVVGLAHELASAAAEVAAEAGYPPE